MRAILFDTKTGAAQIHSPGHLGIQNQMGEGVYGGGQPSFKMEWATPPTPGVFLSVDPGGAERGGQ